MRILNLPKPNIKLFQGKKVLDFGEDESQGITFAGENIWFLSSKYNIFKYSVTEDPLDPSFKRVDRISLEKIFDGIDIPISQKISEINGHDIYLLYDHISDLDYCYGLIFFVVRSDTTTHSDVQDLFFESTSRLFPNPNILVAITKNLEVVGYSILSNDAWDAYCAFNPWNKLLYIENKTHDYLLSYDVSKYFDLKKTPAKWGKNVDIGPPTSEKYNFYDEDGNPEKPGGFQGMKFSNNGRLYVTRAKDVGNYSWSGPWNNYLQIYNALTGVRIGKRRYNFNGAYDEYEGLSIRPDTGVIYAAINENDLVGSDDFQIYAYKYSNVGPQVFEEVWSGGWTQAKPFKVGGKQYLFLLKEGDGTVHIHKIDSYGKVVNDDPEHEEHWSKGWTTVEFYTIGSTTYLFLLKKGHPAFGGGTVNIHKMKSNGSVVDPFDPWFKEVWSGGWTQAKPFKVGGKQYLFLLKEGDGTVHIHKMNSDGKVGHQVGYHDWSEGWTTVEFYTIGSTTYLFLLKKGEGTVHIHKMNSDEDLIPV